MILISSYWANILFDTSASHSFISASFANIYGLEFETLDSVANVGVPLGRYCKLSYGCSSVHIKIGGQQFLADLVVTPME